MKLAIAEYLRSLRERDELDRLLPDLLVSMGYIPLASSQTGNRQHGVDIAARGRNRKTRQNELLLFVVKQGDIGRSEWNAGSQSIHQSIYEIFYVYLRSHIEPQDQNRRVRIVVATGGELKQTVQAEWSGFVSENMGRASIEFWGADVLAALIEKHLLNEHVFLKRDRRDLRRALALSGDSEYDRRDLHRLFLRVLGMDEKGALQEKATPDKALLKALRAINLSAQTFAHWAVRPDGDSRQGLFAMERAVLWVWHRLQLADEKVRRTAIVGPFSVIWSSYRRFAYLHFLRIQPQCFVENGLLRYASNGVEASLVAFENIGILASIAISLSCEFGLSEVEVESSRINVAKVMEALMAWIENNGACTSPCLDRHSQDVTLAMVALIKFNEKEVAKHWLRKLFHNVDYAYKGKKFVPVASDRLDDLVEEGGWLGEAAAERMMSMSWMLATIAGWAAILQLDDVYAALRENSRNKYPEVCAQLWHGGVDVYGRMYFMPAHSESGVTEAPVYFPAVMDEYSEQLQIVLRSSYGGVVMESPAIKVGIPALDWMACRHFSMPITPAAWYRMLE